MKKDNTLDTPDRISMLPDSIVHHIMSCLLDDPKSRVRMSVLSKGWFTLTTSFPILYFCQDSWVHFFYKKFDEEYILEIFYKHVEYTVSRFSEHNIIAHTLYISAQIRNLKQRKLFGRCLDLLLEKGLQIMDIEIYDYARNLSLLRLPNTLLSASSLTSLTLNSCALPSSLTVGVVKFKSLRLLSLSYLPIYKGVIEYLIRGSPLLEEIYLRYCTGFKKFCVKAHQHLLKVEIYCDRKFLVEIVDVEAPNLSYFLFESDKDRDNAPSMFIGSCRKLTTFCYCGCPFKGFNEFLSNFPLLKNVALDLPRRVNNLKLSNNSLRKIQLHWDCDLDEIYLNAPNLLLFEYCSHTDFDYLASREDSSPSKGYMKCEIAHRVDRYQKLRRFLDKNGIFKVLKLLMYSEVIDVQKLKAIQSPPRELELVEIRTLRVHEVSVYATVLDAVLWCCKPRSLTLTVNQFRDTSDVVKYTYEKLLQQGDEGQTNSMNFVLLSSSKDKQYFSDLSSLLTALSLDPPSYKITFIKE